MEQYELWLPQRIVDPSGTNHERIRVFGGKRINEKGSRAGQRDYRDSTVARRRKVAPVQPARGDGNMRKEKVWDRWSDFPIMSRIAFILSVLALLAVILR